MQTVEQIIQQMYLEYEGATDYPETGDEDYDMYLALIVSSVRRWASEGNWRELYTTLADNTGTKVTTASTAKYACPTNYAKPASYAKVGDAYFTYQKVDKTTNTLRVDSDSQFFTITGKPGAFYITFNPAPTESGVTIDYPYYKEPTIPTTGASVLEMTRPLYAVYDGVAKLFQQDYQSDFVRKYEILREEQKTLMVGDQFVVPTDHISGVPDIYNRLSGSGFGI